ncbi:non-ribosomal peptide synthetase [Pseudoalteromonas rhizosphaerae]|uniref:non-ribosomal peptide synthetase n=1 Tax=Pseudoalteromonas rhizosphaerae TaxID=2518973 RepID=UPI002147B2B0|nr:non-ribosomal peptide synthetase [Pseudoalteromonas rhizosphaerae]
MSANTLSRADKLARLKQLQQGKTELALFELTDKQKRFWFTHQRQPSSGLNNIFRAYSFTGRPNITILKNAITAVMEQHPALTSKIVTVKNEPKQFSQTLTKIPFTELTESDTNKVRLLVEQEALAPFELAQSYPCRFKLFANRENPDEFIFTMCFHHIALDGLSVVMVEQAILQHYKQPEQPQSAKSYTFNQLIASQTSAQQTMEQYWLARLANTEHILTLSLQVQQEDREDQRGEYVNFSFDTITSQRITAKCQSLGITPSVFFLAAYQLLLGKLSGQNNFIVSMPELGRSTQQQRSMVGNFANTILFPAQIDASSTLTSFIEKLQRNFYQDLANNQVTVEKLVELLGVERNSNNNPLFQVMYSFNNLEQTEAMPENQKVWSQYPVQRHYSKLDVTLEIKQNQDAYSGYFEYRAALFPKQQIRLWREQLATIIETILEKPTLTIKELSSFSSSQQYSMINQDIDTPEAECFSKRLLRLAEAQSNQPALTAPQQDICLSYAQLMIDVKDIADTISATLVPGQTIVISCTQRLHCVLAVFAAHLTNCPFVVLDQALPKQRQQFILVDSDAAAILSDDHGNLSLNLLNSEASADPKLGYLIYTSGSTGNPKGVRITRQALSNHCNAVAKCYQLNNETKALQFSILSFDLALEELFPILYHGGHVILRPGIETPSFTELNDLINQYQLNHLSLPTGYLSSWLEQLRETEHRVPASLRLVVTGTEQLQNRVVENWFTQGDITQQRLINAYGPSEATISCTAHEVNQLDISRHPIPIGSPLPYSRAYLLDNDGHAVAPYVLAQLYIGGRNLAQGYQNSEAISQEKFSIHPQLKQRLYATGDLAYYDEQGLIYFKGRADDQVKFRGYRIELEEITRQLNQVTGVLTSTCVLQGPALVAYVVSRAKLQQDKLNYLLSKTLPEYMLPDHIVQIDELPLTARGKVDRKALPAVNAVAHQMLRVTPKTHLERLLLEIWQDVLNKPQVCCQTSFFAQGGHSLTALKVLSQLSKKTGKELTLKQFFTAPSISLQSKLLSQQQTRQSMNELVRVARDKPISLTHSQQQMYILDAYAGSASLYNMPLLLQFDGPFTQALLEQALNHLSTRHEAFRTIFTSVQGENKQQVLDSVVVELKQYRLTQTKAKHHFQELLKQRFDLSQPAYKWVSYDLGNNQHWLGLVIHHILCDGASLDILTKELSNCYSYLLQQQPWQPDPLPLQVFDYAHWQHTEQGQQYLAKSKGYWLSELKDMPHRLELPLDKPRPTRPSFAGQRMALTVAKELSEQLEAKANALGVSLYTLSLSAFAILLHEQSRQQDFAIGIPVSGRPGHNLDSTVGLFVNSLPIRMTLSPDDKVSTLLNQTQDRILSGFEQQSLPLHTLVQLLDVERALNYNPLFQVFFNFLTSTGEDSHPITDELTLSLPETPNETARFDLTLTLLASPNGINGHFEFATELFDGDSIEILRDRYLDILLMLAGSGVDTLLEVETAPLTHSQLAHTLGPQTDSEKQLDLLTKIEQHRRHSPTQIAINCGENCWDYQRLFLSIQTRAAQLQYYGVKAGDLVAVSLPRNGELVINLLAIMQCGAAYLPLDPNYPPDRLSFIADDAKAQFLLSDGQSAAFQLPTQCKQLNYLKFETLQDEVMLNPIKPQQQAYCIYTSGSTGKPKGVDISHANLANFLYSMAERPGCDQTDSVLATTPYSFDISVLEMFLPLYCGATLIVANENQSKNGTELAQIIKSHNITLMQGTPASWRLLYSAGWQGKQDLTCLVGGEALPQQLAQQLVQDHYALWNMYGPTETTIWSSLKQIQSDGRITIGKPIHNTQMLVLNDNNQLARFGAKGQLAIAGEGLALGYRYRPELNQEKFISLQVGSTITRAYLTGDLVRQLGNGEYSYLQRIDDQVKLRGYRIELQEIEATLDRVVKLNNVAVVINQSQIEPLLVAFYIDNSDTYDENSLLQVLTKQLPQFMLPTRFIKLPTLPLSPSGKVDKKSLSQYQLTQNTHYQAPQSETEKILCQLWQQILGHSKIGIADNFFKLGGNSILAMRLVSQLNEAFGLSCLTIADVLAHQSITLLSEHIEQVQLNEVDDADLAQLLMELEQE